MGTLISVEEYLGTSFRPDREYLEGEVKERNLGEFDHARLQSKLIHYFGTREAQLGVIGLVSQRVQVRANRFRVLDFCLLSATAPREQIIRTPPLLAVEVLSPDDSLAEMQDRVDDYLDMGVPVVWVIDPKKRHAWSYSATRIDESKNGELKSPGINVHLLDLFD
jgi:Uma2 family endonuclease